MKLLSSIVALILTHSLSAQEIILSEVDEFTGVKKVTTSWEYVGYSMGFSPKMRVIQSDESFFINFKAITHPNVVSVDKGQRLFFKFEDESILALYNSEYTIGCLGCGATGIGGSEGQGIELFFQIDKQDLIELREKTIIKVRLETNQGYRESKTKAKHSEKIKSLVDLVI